jgi:two-component sensor histidine kinase
MVKASVATVLAMSIHELCTNAVKYGALSNDVGTVSITWALSGPAEDQTFTLAWVERGGPVVKTPQRTGFGSRMIKDALAAQTHGTVEMLLSPPGLAFRLTAPARAVLALPEIAEPAGEVSPAEA